MDNEKKKIKSKRPPEVKKRRRKRAVAGSFGALIFISIALVIFLNIYGSTLLANFITKTVEYRSEGLFQVSFGKIEIHFLKLGFDIEDFRLIPNQEIYSERKGKNEVKNGLYDIAVPKFSLRGLRPSLAFYDNVFVTSEIQIDRPEIKLIDIPIFADKTRYQEGYDDIKPIIVSLVEYLLVEKLIINEGVFDIFLEENSSGDSFTASTISLILKGFQIDKKTEGGENKFMYSDEANITFLDYKLNLKDSIHTIEANEIGINTFDSVIYIHGFNLHPGQKSKSDLLRDGESYITAFFPEIKMSKAQVIKAYTQDTFNIGELSFLRPQIKYAQLSKVGGKIVTEDFQINLFPLIRGYLKNISINKFSINNGVFDLDQPNETIKENMGMRNISVYANDFSLDSLAYQDPTKIFYSSELDLSFKDFHLALKDNLHDLKASELNISTTNRSIDAKKLSIRPNVDIAPGKNKKSLFYIEIPEVEITDIGLIDFYFKGKLSANLVKIFEPQVKVVPGVKRSLASKDSSKSSAEFYELLSRYIAIANIKSIDLNNGIFSFNQHQLGINDDISADQISIKLYDFLLDSNAFFNNSHMLFSNNIDFRLEDYDFKLPDEIHEIKMEAINFSTQKKYLSIKGLNISVMNGANDQKYLFEHGKSGYFELQVPHISLNNFDVKEALLSQKFLLERLIIDSLNFKSLSYPLIKKDASKPPREGELYEIIKPFTQLIKIDNLLIKKANTSFFEKFFGAPNLKMNNHVSLNLNNIEISEESLLDTDRFLFSNEVYFQLKEQNIYLDDEVHSILIDSAKYLFPDEKLRVDGFKLKANREKLSIYNAPVFLEANASTGVFSGLKLDGLQNKQKLMVDSASFDTIYFDIFQTKFYVEDSVENSESMAMPILMEELKLRFLEIGYGVFRYFDRNGTLIAEGEVNGQLKRALISDYTIGSNNSDVPFEQLELNFPKFTYNLEAYHQKLNLNDVNLNLQRGEVKVGLSALDFDTTMTWSQMLEKEMKAFRKVTSDSIKISGFDFEKYFLNKEFTVGDIRFYKPEIEEHVISLATKEFTFTRADVFPFLAPFCHYVQIDSTHIVDGTYRRYDYPLDSNEIAVDISNIYLDMADTFIDSTAYKDSVKIAFSDDVTFRVRNVKRDLPDSMYAIEADEIGVSTGSSMIFANNIRLRPKYDRYNFSRVLGFQTDRIELDAVRVELQNVDLLRFYKEDFIDIGQVFVRDLTLVDHRDKRVPLREDFLPPMPQELVRLAPKSFIIDSMFLLGGNFTYEEFAPEGRKAGHIDFNNVNAKVYRLSNQPSYYGGDSSTYMFAFGKLMNQGDIIFRANLNMLDTANNFNIQGSLGVMDMTAINPMLENVAFTSIKSGVVRSIKFSAEADDNLSKGDMEFRYSKFKVFVVNKKTGKPEGIEEGIASFFANTFLINRQNPRLGFFKEGDIYFKRDKRKSIVNYWWKSIFSGIKTSIGAQTQKKLIKIAEKEDK